MAQELRCGQAKIHKMETRLVAISLPELEILIDLYQVPAAEAAEMRVIAELDLRDGPARTKYSGSMTAFGELSELEPEAREIRCWHSERIPGPLQSEMYLLKQHESMLIKDPAAVTLVLRERTARRKVLTVPNPPRYRVVLSESSLHRMPGGRTTQMVVDQTEHLLNLLDDYHHLDLRILTFDAKVPYVDSDFQHLMFDDPGQCEFAYIEYPGGSRKCKNSQELMEFREHWTTLLSAALDPASSREFLRGLTAR